MVKCHIKNITSSDSPVVDVLSSQEPPVLAISNGNVLSVSSNCFSCQKEFNNADALGCHKCNSWFHPKCATVKQSHFNALCALGQSVDWYCSICSVARPDISASENEIDIDSTNKILCKLDSLCTTVNMQAAAIKDLQTLQKAGNEANTNKANDHAVPSVHRLGNSYSDVVRTLKRHDSTIQPVLNGSNTPPISKKMPPKENVLVLSGSVDKSRVFNHASMLKELSTLFPRIRLTSSSLKPNGLIFLAFATQVDAQTVCDGWNPTHLGSNTKINFYQPGIGTNSVIIKNVPVSMSEAEIMTSIVDQFTSCKTVKRFIKNGTPLQVVQVSFAALSDFNAILQDGVFLDSLFLTVDKFVQLKQPTRCFNCNAFGHTASNCKGKTVCGKCADGHKTSECSFTTKKCKNCLGAHASYDRNCPRYLELLNKMNTFL